MLKPSYLMIGGFLGAGKTTSILQLARRLQDRDLRVGLITNDQSFGLVDTTMLRSHGFETEEITGGCFCCRFGSLIDAANKLTKDSRPDIFLAEPVGSCTDLRATVSYPLRQMYGDDFTIAPLSVVLDPIRAARILGLEQGKTFSPKVSYIYEKQMEEADILVINKCDLVDERQQSVLQDALAERFPQATVVRVAARTGTGIDEWLQLLQDAEGNFARSIEIDYAEYGEGESLLGWLNLSATLSGAEFDGNVFLTRLASDLRDRLESEGVEVAHLKMTLTPDSGNDLAVGNLVRNSGAVELSHELAEPLEAGQLIVNFRAEGDPALLQRMAEEELSRLSACLMLQVEVDHIEAFRPGMPVPTHRLAEVL